MRAFGIVLVFLVGTVASAQEYVPGEVIVKMKHDPSQKGVASFSTQNFKSKSSKEMTLKQSFHHLRMHRLSLKAGQNVEAMVETLKADPNVEYAEPNYIVNKSTLETASHVVSFEDAQAAYYEVGAQSGSNFHQSNANMQVESAWSMTSNGASSKPAEWWASGRARRGATTSSSSTPPRRT